MYTPSILHGLKFFRIFRTDFNEVITIKGEIMLNTIQNTTTVVTFQNTKNDHHYIQSFSAGADRSIAAMAVDIYKARLRKKPFGMIGEGTFKLTVHDDESLSNWKFEIEKI